MFRAGKLPEVAMALKVFLIKARSKKREIGETFV